MSCPRLIPLLLHKHGRLVLSRQFQTHHDIGDPVQIADRYKGWDLDELIYLDISTHWPCVGRMSPGFAGFLDAIRQVGRNCFVPLTVGGGITGLDQINALLHAGADRFVLNSQALADPSLLSRAADHFGAQAVVLAVDARRMPDGGYQVFADGGRRPTGRTVEEWCHSAEQLGAGEILVNSIDRDGSGEGFDLHLVRRAAGAVRIPVVACGGAGDPADLAAPIKDGGASGVAAANLFAFRELSYHAGKQALLAAGVDVREGLVSRDYALARRQRASTASRLGAEAEDIWMELERSGWSDVKGPVP